MMTDSSSATLEENGLSTSHVPVVTSVEETPTTLEETIVEETIVEQVLIETFVDVVKKLIETDDKIKINLTPEVKIVLNNMISLTPNTLNDIEKALTEIVKDNKIDSVDIPNLIIVIQRVYQFIYSLKSVKFNSKKRSEITCILLKYIIHIWALSNISEDKRELFLVQTNALVDSCSNLLSFSKTIKTPGCLKLFRNCSKK